MVRREEADVFADDRPPPVEGGEHALGRNGGESLDVGVAGIEENVALLVLLDPHAEVVEQFGKKIPQEGIGVNGLDRSITPAAISPLKELSSSSRSRPAFIFRSQGMAKGDGFPDQFLQLGFPHPAVPAAFAVGEGQGEQPA